MDLKITYIGHATLLIEWNGLNILTDPVFSDRILCFKRSQPLSYDPTKLPKLDAVLLSHAHYDHLDIFSFKYIPEDVPILIPEGMSKAIAPFVNNPVIELTTWSKFSVNGSNIAAVPTKHFGGRLIIPYRYRKCTGYVITKEGKSIYFAGDSAYGSHFSKIQAAYNPFFAFLPITFRSSNFFFDRFHMNPRNIIQAWEDLGKPNWMPIHWGSFFQEFRNSRKAVEKVENKSQQRDDLKNKFHLVEPGKSLIFSAEAPRLKVVNSSD